MATLNGIVRFSGQLGDLVFYKRGKKDVVRQKTSAYQLSEKSRKSAHDFGEASRNAAYIRKAFAPMVKSYGYGDLHNRLNKRLVAVFATVPAANAGNKRLADGNVALLQGFEFNAATRLERLLHLLPEIHLLNPGSFQLLLPKVETGMLLRVMPKADFAVLQVMVFNFNLNNGQYEIIQVNDLQVAMAEKTFPGAKLSLPVEPDGDRVLLVAIGISYVEDGSRRNDRRYFACQLVHCLHLRDGVEVVFETPVKERVVVKEERVDGVRWELG
ncbi:hypothetical protein [Pedobacter aquatilis]|uniref:hypothetical protein n=1 Tax=Pedobacter aquatilis TaxID=351343 RepID=UPI00293023A7|nr:hypothetical protein [Pedobacter aquatilis]